MDFLVVDTEKYTKGMFELFKQSTNGEISNEIIKEYEKNPAEASARDAMDLSLMMYYSLSHK